MSEDAQILEMLEHSTYEQTATALRVSRGRVWRVAVRRNARKHEARIQERVQEREARRKEFLAEVLNATEKSDVLDFLNGLPDQSVQMHLTSVPYNVGKPYGGSDHIDQLRFHYYLGWMLMVLSEMVRTLADGGVLFLQVGNTRTDKGELYPLDVLFYEHLVGMGLTPHDRVVWVKPHGIAPKGKMRDAYETALVFSKGKLAHFYPTPGRTPQKEPTKRAYRGPNKGKLSGNPLGAHPSNVWSISTVKHGNSERTGHPAQFPEELVRRAILMYTAPGELVCDVFVGSGTTAAVAKATQRSFTGCDLFYEDLRRERLAKVRPDLVSVLPGVSEENMAVWQAEARPVREQALLE